MRFLGYDKVLCLSPHPDDVEYGMLGTIMKYSRTRFDVITASVGGNFDTSSGVSRFTECLEVCNGIDNMYSGFLDVDHVKNTTEDEYIKMIEEKKINPLKSPLIIVPSVLIIVPSIHRDFIEVGGWKDIRITKSNTK